MPNTVMGLDLSYTCTGICTRAGSYSIVPPKGEGKGIDRQVWIRKEIMFYAEHYKITLVVQEDYAFAARGRVFHIGELGGIIKMALYEREIDVLVVPPATLKQYATGKGNASKDEVIQGVRKVGYEPANSDEADACALYDMGVFAAEKGMDASELLRKCRLL